MFRTVLHGMWSHKRRLVGTGTAVVLGVAFLVATLVLGDTMRTGFGQLIATGNAGTDVIVRNSTVLEAGEEPVRGQLDEAVVSRVAEVDGVGRAAAAVEGIAQVLAADGEPIGGNGPPTLAGNWIDDPDLNSWHLSSGRAPRADDEVVLDVSTADRGDLAIGDTATVLTPQPVEVTIVGLAKFGDLDGVSGATYVAFTMQAAQEHLIGRTDEITSVLVHADGSVSPETLRARVASVIPTNAEALTGSELTAEQQADMEGDFINFFETFLLAFAGIALLVATFSIHNTFSILVAQRTRESALLRALGASRRQIVGSVASEALVVGAGASAVGLGAGAGIAYGLKALLASIGLEMSMSGIVVEADSVVIAAAVGIVVTLVASLVPAIKASRVPPLAAMRDVAVDRTAASKTRALIGALLAAGGVALVVNATSSADGALARAGLGALIVVAGAVVLGPVAARPAAAVLGSPLPVLRGQTGRLARRNAMRNPRRTAGSASALMVGTAVVVLFTTFGASIKASLDDTVDRTFGGDLVIEQDGFSGATIDPAAVGAIEALPEVAAAAPLSGAVMRLDGADSDPLAVDPTQLAAILDLDVQSGDLAGMRSGQMAVSERYADDHGLALGSVLHGEFADGATSDLVVSAVYAEGDIVGDLLITRDDWMPHAGRAGDMVVLIDLADGVGLDEGKAAVDAATRQFAAPQVQTRDEYMDSVAAEIDQMLTFVYGLLALAVLIALMGIANTLSLSIHERTRELGLLRAVGQTRRQLRSSVRWESVIIAVFGTLGGIGLGTFLGWGLIRALAVQEGFGTFAVPAGQLAVIVGLAAAAGVLAAVRPARRAARLDILEAIATPS
ncbi:MAG: ABC transporter permease [Ilumatobacteraceae bacterium]